MRCAPVARLEPLTARLKAARDDLYRVKRERREDEFETERTLTPGAEASQSKIESAISTRMGPMMTNLVGGRGLVSRDWTEFHNHIPPR